MDKETQKKLYEKLGVPIQEGVENFQPLSPVNAVDENKKVIEAATRLRDGLRIK
jgi:hypothetical protein